MKKLLLLVMAVVMVGCGKGQSVRQVESWEAEFKNGRSIDWNAFGSYQDVEFPQHVWVFNKDGTMGESSSWWKIVGKEIHVFHGPKYRGDFPKTYIFKLNPTVI